MIMMICLVSKHVSPLSVMGNFLSIVCEIITSVLLNHFFVWNYSTGVPNYLPYQLVERNGVECHYIQALVSTVICSIQFHQTPILCSQNHPLCFLIVMFEFCVNYNTIWLHYITNKMILWKEKKSFENQRTFGVAWAYSNGGSPTH